MVPLTLLVTAISAVPWFAPVELLPRPMDRTGVKKLNRSVVAVVGQRRVPYPIMLVFVVRASCGRGSELFSSRARRCPRRCAKIFDASRECFRSLRAPREFGIITPVVSVRVTQRPR